ncbi:MAG TPA: VOC family protein [Gemmatimonadales bacterium]|nr:VOC family protein [Gemmatimonadales bacterium]
MTPVLVVDAVAPCLAFWVDRFGFTLGHQVPGDDGQLVFGSVNGDGIELMYQTRASVIAEDDGRSVEERTRDVAGHSIVLFFEVEDFAAVERAVAGALVVKPRHQTFYGTVEIYIREAGGHVVGFSAPAPS